MPRFSSFLHEAGFNGKLTTPYIQSFRSVYEYQRDGANACRPNGRHVLFRVADVFLRPWDLGFTAFGGPPVHFQIPYQRFVESKGYAAWVNDQTYRELFAVSQALSGRASTKMLFNLVMYHAGVGLCYTALWYFPAMVGIGGVVAVVWDIWLSRAIGRLQAKRQQRRINEQRAAKESQENPEGLRQHLPKINFNFTVYLGAFAVKNSDTTGFAGALLSFIGIFVPGLTLSVGVAEIWQVLRTKAAVAIALRGINATAVGSVFTDVYRLWEIGYLTPDSGRGKSLANDPWWVVVAAITYSGSAWFKVLSVMAILLDAVLGLGWYWVAGRRILGL